MKILFLTGLVIWIFAGPISAQPAAMVDRHIFVPEVSSEQKEEAPIAAGAAGAALEKEILFTGVLITPKGKKAIITENAKNEKTKQRHVLKTGDQIKEMTIKEIGPNYVLLASKENTVRLNLYKGAKTRPAAAADIMKPEPGPAAVHPGNGILPGMTADAQQPGTGRTEAAPGGGGVPGGGGPADSQPEAPSPFGGRGSASPSQGNSGSAPNPFAEILKKGVERRNPSGQGNSPGALPFNLPGN